MRVGDVSDERKGGGQEGVRIERMGSGNEDGREGERERRRERRRERERERERVREGGKMEPMTNNEGVFCRFSFSFKCVNGTRFVIVTLSCKKAMMKQLSVPPQPVHC